MRKPDYLHTFYDDFKKRFDPLIAALAADAEKQGVSISAFTEAALLALISEAGRLAATCEFAKGEEFFANVSSGFSKAKFFYREKFECEEAHHGHE